MVRAEESSINKLRIDRSKRIVQEKRRDLQDESTVFHCTTARGTVVGIDESKATLTSKDPVAGTRIDTRTQVLIDKRTRVGTVVRYLYSSVRGTLGFRNSVDITVPSRGKHQAKFGDPGVASAYINLSLKECHYSGTGRLSRH